MTLSNSYLMRVMQLDPKIHFENEFQRNEYYKIRVDSLGLPHRVESALASASVRTIGGILRHSDEDLLKIRGLGVKGLRYIADKINSKISDYESIELSSPRTAVPVENSPVVLQEMATAILAQDEDIIESFAGYLGVSKEAIVRKSRKKEMVELRDIVVYFLREYARMSFPAIGNLLYRDHTTIMHSYEKTRARIQPDDDLKTRFPGLVNKALLIKERKEYVKQTVIPTVLAGIRMKSDAKTSKRLLRPILPRNQKILDLYREGLTLQDIATPMRLSRERVRQIVEKTIEQIAIRESISLGVEMDVDVLKAEARRKRAEASLPVTAEKSNGEIERRWSRYYVACKSCGTTTFPHLRKGLCEQCLGGFRAERREEIIRRHNTCELCTRSRAEAVALYGRDFYITKDKKVFCRGCFLKYTGKKLSSYRRHVWSRLYQKCLSCGTTTTPHFANGLCEECGGKISDEKRLAIIAEHNNKCDKCGIDQMQARITLGRGFYLTKNGHVLCRTCFQKHRFRKNNGFSADRKSSEILARKSLE